MRCFYAWWKNEEQPRLNGKPVIHRAAATRRGIDRLLYRTGSKGFVANAMVSGAQALPRSGHH